MFLSYIMKSCLLLLLVFLSGCGFGNDNKVSIANIDSDDEMIINSLSEVVYVFDYDLNNEDYPYLNIWVDKYVAGEKEEDAQVLSYNLSESDSDIGKFVYSFNIVNSEDNEHTNFDVNLIFAESGGGVTTSYVDELFSTNGEHGLAHGAVDPNLSESLSGDEEIALASISINDGESSIPGLEMYAPSGINFDDYIKEIAGSIDTYYVMKAQFSKE